MDRKILVIDDEPPIRNLMAEFFKHEGFEVFTAGRSEEGLSILKKEKPPLVFLDLFLGTESGLDVLREIKKAAPDTVVVMLSGGHDEEKAKEAIQLGAYDYVTKPVSLRRLMNDFVDRIFLS